MSRKHFKALAEALKRRKPEAHWSANKMVQWRLDVKAIADVCGEFDDRFEYRTFLSACDYDEENVRS